MIRMRIDDIAEVLGGTIITGHEPVDISDLSIGTVSSDSRENVKDGLFVALHGEHVDGHNFLASAQEHGFIAALVDHEVEGSTMLQIEVSDTVEALGHLARHNIDMRRATGKPFSLIGITGSVGKTTTKDITKTLLSSLAPTVAPVGSFNNELGLPLTALTVNEGTRYFVAEMGANHLGEIRGLTAIAPPDISVVLKVGTAHLGEFGSVENIFIAKSEIVEALAPNGLAILNSDDVNVARMQERTQAPVMWFGEKASMAQEASRELSVSCSDVDMDDADRASFTVLVKGAPVGRIHLGIPGRHNVMNALAAISIAVAEGMKPEAVVAVLNKGVALSPHRMAFSDVTVGQTSFTLIDDSFNANPDSMKSGLDGLMGTHHAQAFHVAVLGPMLELGKDSETLHEQVGDYAITAGADAVISVGLSTSEDEGEAIGEGEDLAGLAADIAKGALAAASSQGSGAVVQYVETLEAAEKAVVALASSHPDTVVLLKGSHASGLGNLAQRWSSGTESGGRQTENMTSATDGE
ncbi:MAG: UDP-N-acetylmuramoyl-tripeptide--D-alanyl-D-alanine ligase [Bifidobacteriaceae bacterium]|jgi:UDP-N-acetylmuramoyl-tripeptide--D-alanyl-D-alanine ligase|nr:UDP-N-acetylmuramoyl-tripeptide--D-alanyl-D-alanine ligase [Bifidobacteriaceae bacterium]MCI1979070.1 UDP-N-acetylmuramoyl-tripeptide--D-alanyl-D-alanine ligase [Bifidobacteriaceae bacterium]